MVIDAQPAKRSGAFPIFRALKNSPYRSVIDRWQTTRHSEVTHTNAIA